MHPFLARSLLVLVSAVPALITGCGASYERLYEGDVRFEHCYRLDVEPNVAANQRRGCWANWARYHTDGQPRNRVEYALARERALLGGDARAVGPNLTTSAVSASAAAVQVPLLPATGAVACPIPNTPFEPPPATLPKAKAMNGPSVPAAPGPSASAAPQLTPHQECVRDCGDTFTRCATACTQDRCVARCGDKVKKCISDCL
jgi:hypothetical protein